jgi:hypothetical protein
VAYHLNAAVVLRLDINLRILTLEGLLQIPKWEDETAGGEDDQRRPLGINPRGADGRNARAAIGENSQEKSDRKKSGRNGFHGIRNIIPTSANIIEMERVGLLEAHPLRISLRGFI